MQILLVLTYILSLTQGAEMTLCRPNQVQMDWSESSDDNAPVNDIDLETLRELHISRKSRGINSKFFDNIERFRPVKVKTSYDTNSSLHLPTASNVVSLLTKHPSLENNADESSVLFISDSERYHRDSCFIQRPESPVSLISDCTPGDLLPPVTVTNTVTDISKILESLAVEIESKVDNVCQEYDFISKFRNPWIANHANVCIPFTCRCQRGNYSSRLKNDNKSSRTSIKAKNETMYFVGDTVKYINYDGIESEAFMEQQFLDLKPIRTQRRRFPAGLNILVEIYDEYACISCKALMHALEHHGYSYTQSEIRRGIAQTGRSLDKMILGLNGLLPPLVRAIVTIMYQEEEAITLGALNTKLLALGFPEFELPDRVSLYKISKQYGFPVIYESSGRRSRLTTFSTIKRARFSHTSSPPILDTIEEMREKSPKAYAIRFPDKLRKANEGIRSRLRSYKKVQPRPEIEVYVERPQPSKAQVQSTAVPIIHACSYGSCQFSTKDINLLFVHLEQEHPLSMKPMSETAKCEICGDITDSKIMHSNIDMCKSCRRFFYACISVITSGRQIPKCVRGKQCKYDTYRVRCHICRFQRCVDRGLLHALNNKSDKAIRELFLRSDPPSSIYLVRQIDPKTPTCLNRHNGDCQILETRGQSVVSSAGSAITDSTDDAIVPTSSKVSVEVTRRKRHSSSVSDNDSNCSKEL